MTKRIYRSMQGKPVDIEALRTRNETTVAVGNKPMNARGDELGPGGKIIRKRVDVVAEYYDTNPNAVPKQNPVTSTVSKSNKAITHKTEGKKK